ncbi:CASP-like protein 1E2 [Rutidosis leptorrhynchoides]|uniref:CASP-like protein 1E2 n=1 Tax=Rutidosis leptorrhynchoides TaxID=125765 RepID=UPI003A99042B
METDHKEMEVINRRSINIKDLVIRLLALALTLVAAVVLGVDKQNTTVAITLVPSLPPVNLPVTAKWTHLSAFVYLVIANAIAFSYAATSLILTVVTRGKSKLVTLITTILDLVMVALLFSAIGATGSVGLIGYKGNSHVKWDKVCNVFDTFCYRVTVSLLISFAASVAYIVLIVIAFLNLYKKY